MSVFRARKKWVEQWNRAMIQSKYRELHTKLGSNWDVRVSHVI
jgi:hypothetical protein